MEAPRRSARVAGLATSKPEPKKRAKKEPAPAAAAAAATSKDATPVAGLAKLCCLRACSKALSLDQMIVEVRSGDRLESEDSKAIWGAAGRAQFHGDCWQVLLRGIAPRYKGPDQLSAAERRCVKEAAARAEYYDAPKAVEEKAAQFAARLQKARHAVIFTGAGVSTAAGIGDYRGLTGKWTLEELAPKEEEVIDEGVPYESLRPTYTHEAITKLIELGLIKYVISQNCDGLHLLSGVPEDRISELHGNVFKEFCVKCQRTYVRDFYVMDDSDESDNCPRCHFNHLTGRKCSVASCKGALSDTIINFGDLLHEETLRRAEKNSSDSDLFISLGSTMLVTPAAKLIERASASVICNRQKTEYDDSAVVRAYGDCDVFFKFVMKTILGEAEEGYGARFGFYLSKCSISS